MPKYSFEQLAKDLWEADCWEGSLTLKRQEFLIRPGDKEYNTYYIMSGSLRVFFMDEEEEQVIRLGYQGNLIGALDTFTVGEPSRYYVQAIKKTELRFISKTRLEAFVSASIERAWAWQELLKNMIYQQLEREQDILTSSPLERYRRVLSRSPQLFQHIPARHVASYLRMTPETLSRIRAQEQKP